MEQGLQRWQERLERNERLIERISAVLEEHSRRLEALEDLPARLSEINQSLGRLEAKLEAQKNHTNLLQALLWLIIGGVLAAGFEFLKRN